MNNVCAQCFQNHGPTPVGTYHIGEGFLDPGRHTISYRLTPLDMRCYHTDPPRYRDSFLIHYGFDPAGRYSTGCIIIPESETQDDREELNLLGGGTLEVIASTRPFSYDTGCMGSARADQGAHLPIDWELWICGDYSKPCELVDACSGMMNPEVTQ